MKRNAIILISLLLGAFSDARSQFADYDRQAFDGKSANWTLYAIVIMLVAASAYWIIYSLKQRLEEEKIISGFATSLFGLKTVEDIFWDTAKNCVEKLGFVDCVIYQKDEFGMLLFQKAAFGPKNPFSREIVNRLEIPVGKGVVGWVAETGRGIIIKNTAKDPRYIVDDEVRLSEIAVPISIDGKVFAVIDSEHPKPGFYSPHHLQMLEKIAAICAERIAKYVGEDRLRSKIARDLHDEIGSTLTSINILCKVAMQQGIESEKLNDYLGKIKDNSARMMESMSDIVWAINPVNDSMDKVILHMKEFAAEMLEPAGINYYFNEEGAMDKAHLNLEQRKDIYLVFKEALNNAVKYSNASEIDILLQQKNDILKMIIMDNGNGFDTTAEHSGNGLKNMRTRSEQMKAHLTIDSKKCGGTSIILEAPIT
ncbi:MAG TPA: GAF domain-containing protein [Agriterribacter sp.]|nr:GAF domain-containing protein [Agriterribacter sp.]